MIEILVRDIESTLNFFNLSYVAIDSVRLYKAVELGSKSSKVLQNYFKDSNEALDQEYYDAAGEYLRTH